jgi:predicted alpha/beta hydrolase family esterase
MHVKGGQAMTPILIIPGLGGSGPHHWQTCLERSFPGTSRVWQDDWDRPDRSLWVGRLVAAIEAAPGAVLVAHSLGCALVAHVAAERPDLPVEAALLVAPADVDSAVHTPGHVRGFAPIPRAPLPFRSTIVASTNDPFMTFVRARELANAWGSDLVDAGAIGHINVDSGLGPWPAGEGILRRVMTARRYARFLAPLSAHP